MHFKESNRFGNMVARSIVMTNTITKYYLFVRVYNFNKYWICGDARASIIFTVSLISDGVKEGVI